MLIFDYIVQSIKQAYYTWFTFDQFKAARCPGCGRVGKKRIQFVHTYERIVLTCPRCSAAWGHECVAPYADWKITGLAEFMEVEDAKELERLKLEQAAKLNPTSS